MHCIVHTDGGARGNPGPAGVGVVIAEAQSKQPLHEAGYFIGKATNNVAEYEGLLRALKAAKEVGATQLSIHSDSQLMVRQIIGEYRVKSADLQPLFEQAQRLLIQFDRWKIDHVRREQNKRADELANLAMDAKRDIIVIGNGAEPAAPTASEPAPVAAAELPCFTAELAGKQRQCLAGQAAGNEYTFGPTTPEGFCVHAAAAVLSDGPLQWSAGKRTGQTRCGACRQPIVIKRLT